MRRHEQSANGRETSGEGSTASCASGRASSRGPRAESRKLFHSSKSVHSSLRSFMKLGHSRSGLDNPQRAFASPPLQTLATSLHFLLLCSRFHFHFHFNSSSQSNHQHHCSRPALREPGSLLAERVAAFAVGSWNRIGLIGEGNGASVFPRPLLTIGLMRRVVSQPAS